MRTKVIAALALTAIMPGVAAAQAERVASRLDDATRTAVVRTVEQARVHGLPMDPLVDKAVEGVTKHAPGPRIAAAVSAMYDRMIVARDALAPAPTSADVVSGADALAAGVPRSSLESLRALRPDRPIAVPLAVLAQLVAQGVPVARATSMVETVVRRGARDDQLVAVGERIREDIAAGVAPEAAVDIRSRGLHAVLPPVAPGSADGSGGRAVSNGPGTRP